MVIITDAQGNIQSPTIPENVYQGSNFANEIVFLSPLPQNNQCAIKFRLANGLVTTQRFMTPFTSVPSQYGLNAWVYRIPMEITQYAGQVTFQVKMYSGGEQVVMSCAGTFPVIKGVVPLPNEVPSPSTFDEIMEYLQTLADGSMVSKGILPYDSEFSYPLGASVFDESTSAIYTSLAVNNLGNDLSDTTYWKKSYILTPAEIQQYLDVKMDKTNPVGSGSFSLNRKNGTTVGSNSVAVGGNTEASGLASTATGISTKASGAGAFASGVGSEASGDGAVAVGRNTKAKSDYQVAIGKNNIEDSTSQYAEIVGNGTDETPSNARTLDWSGNETLAGSLTAGSIIKSGGTASQLLKANGGVAGLKNEYSNSQDDIYSANYVNSRFVPMSFASRLYAKVESSTSATLEDEKPVVSSSNKISVTTTNTDFDFTSPMFTLIRTLTNEITLNNTNSFAVDLYFDCSRAVTLGFGAKIKVSSDNGETWSYISSNQSFGDKYYTDGLNNEDIVVYTDNVGDETLAIGTLIAIEIFTKQDSSTSLTTDYICGVEIGDADVYSFAEFNFANTNINTNQIEDGAVTYNKLANDVKAKFEQVEVVEVQGSYAVVTDMPYQYEITFTLPSDFDLTSIKEYLFKFTTSISLVNLTNIRIFVQKDFQTINILTPYNNGVSYANENDLAQVFNNSNGWEFKGIMQSNGLLVEMDNLTSVRAEIGNIDTLLTTLNSGGGV